MPNDNHLRRLMDVLGDWNQWRTEHPEITPDLSDADLSGQFLLEKNLAGANLKRANLANAQLRKVDLRGAKAHGLIARSASFFECNLDACELSERAQYRHTVPDNTLLIDAYSARPARLAEIPHDRRADLTDATFHRSSLRGAILDMAELYNVNLYDTPLTSASLVGAHFCPRALHNSSLAHANLAEADLGGANLSAADLSHANLRNAVLVDANLGPGRVVHMQNVQAAGGKATTVGRFEHPEHSTILRGADLRGADLRNACLVQADLRDADLRGARVFGVSAWNVMLEGARQEDLVATHPTEPALLVEGLELAQFMHLMLNNERLRQIIDTITSSVVLILGNFSPEWKPILDAIRHRLRKSGYIPVMFDFARPKSRSLTETVDLLARMSRFVVVDISEPRSSPHEIRGIAESARSVPIVPLCHRTKKPYAMFEDYRTCAQVLDVVKYQDLTGLMDVFDAQVIAAAEQKVGELRSSMQISD